MTRRYDPTPDYRAGEAFTPCAEQMALMPAASGNAINGLDETAPRRPSPIYWHHPSTIAHGPVQRWMLQRCVDLEEGLRDLNHKYGGRGPREPVPVAPEKAEDTPGNWARRVKEQALAGEAVLVGIAAIDPEWVFEGYEVPERWAVMLGIAMDHEKLSRVAPHPDSAIEVMAQYNMGVRAAKALADWIRGQGHHAVGHGGPIAGPFTMIPAALACGFGELGKHGSIINRTYGSSFRLAAVLTDLPLVADAPDVFGADDFCLSCRVCARNCPPGAISHDRRMVRGVERWYVDFDKCVPYFNETYGCGICIAVCPWSRPGTAPSLARRMTRRRERSSG